MEAMQDVMVFIGLSATFTSGKTIASRGLQGYPKTATGQEVLRIVDNAMDRVQYIKSLPHEARQAWSALISERHAISHQLQALDGGYRARTISVILKAPTKEQKALVRQYLEVQKRIDNFELRPLLIME